MSIMTPSTVSIMTDWQKKSDVIVRRVVVNRNLTPQQVINSTRGLRKHVTKSVLATMLKGRGIKKDVYFFKLTPDECSVFDHISMNDFDRAFERRGLKSDPYAHIQVNVDDRVLAEEHPNGSFWRDPDGRVCFVKFSFWIGKPYVRVACDYYPWYGEWWLAGVRK